VIVFRVFIIDCFSCWDAVFCDRFVFMHISFPFRVWPGCIDRLSMGRRHVGWPDDACVFSLFARPPTCLTSVLDSSSWKKTVMLGYGSSDAMSQNRTPPHTRHTANLSSFFT
jgi:hypothetical protein